MKRTLSIALRLFLVFILPVQAFAQEASSATEIMNAIDKRKTMGENSLLKNYPVRSIGPVVQGARIVDLAVNEDNPREFYVAFASGGVFYTKNNGITLEPVFDNEGALTIGDITLAPSDPKVLYVGTGENNSSRSSYAGSGVYKTTDGGKTWEHLGLDAIHHTGRIIVHPENPDVAWVGAMGALYSTNSERGVYKTTDGGKTWDKTLYVNDSTGIIDLIIHPEDPDRLWAASWDRIRYAWDFRGEGEGSAIYYSEDGGETWTVQMEGIPHNEKTGRIGLDISRSNPDIIYAILDNQGTMEREEDKEKQGDDLRMADFNEMTREEFMDLDTTRLNKFLKDQGFPEKYDAAKVRQEIRDGKYEIKALAEYFGDANEALFNTSIIGTEIYRSEDAGKTWNKVNEMDLQGVYFTYGYYFGEIRVNPTNPEHIYIMGVPMLASRDGGKNFARADTIGDVHSDHHSMWIDPSDSEHVILGNDGGLYMSYDAGATWDHINNTSVGQFYTVNVDMEKPYNVYGGLQDNGTLVGSSESVPNETEKWERIFGGDGMYVAPDPRNPSVVYAGFQFGNYYRIDRDKNSYTYISPKHDIGEPTLRYNWRTPLILSPHNPEIVYIGAQKVYRSLDRGDNWQAISGDLTRDLPQGNVPHSTITSLAESPLSFGLIYAGTDDGKLQVTRNGGATWTDVSNGLPDNLWVSSVFPSPHDEATVFATLTGYRYDDFHAYLYKSTDYGRNWTSVKGDLPEEAINVLIQDPVNPELLYTGTDLGTYVSMNGGDNWQHLGTVPNVASYDMIVHPRENELVIATHGRSIYVMDVKPLQQIAGKGKAVAVYAPAMFRHSERWGERQYDFSSPFLPELNLLYYAEEAGTVTLEVLNENGTVLREEEVQANAGFNSYKWNLKVEGTPKGRRRKKDNVDMVYAGKGKYTLRVKKGSASDSTKVEIK
ncbi:WD40/YVTN/BNR-like repeat-containing protein [Roseivirga sp. BDSF3-8]|uniref:WD40/YVTN/BNR-like repeat-containing protein n=1 Tax=Roseivirga sp. BDSF3-8 TaxID=3241598 RepID=UPI00353211FE